MSTPEQLLSRQPPPISGGFPVLDWLLALMVYSPVVRRLFELRRADGVAAYRTELCTHNGRDVVADLVQEQVDACFYAAQGVLEGRVPREVLLAQIGVLERTLRATGGSP